MRRSDLILVTDRDDTSYGGEAGRCAICRAAVGEPHDPTCENSMPMMIAHLVCPDCRETFVGIIDEETRPCDYVCTCGRVGLERIPTLADRINRTEARIRTAARFVLAYVGAAILFALAVIVIVTERRHSPWTRRGRLAAACERRAFSMLAPFRGIYG